MQIVSWGFYSYRTKESRELLFSYLKTAGGWSQRRGSQNNMGGAMGEGWGLSGGSLSLGVEGNYWSVNVFPNISLRVTGC